MTRSTLSPSVRQVPGRTTNAAIWERSAACSLEDIELFFGPAEPEGHSEREDREERAKRVCARCPVIEPCRASALTRGERFGVWGGLGERERRRLLRRIAG